MAATFLAIVSLKKGFAQGEVSHNPKCDSIFESNVTKAKTSLTIEKSDEEAIVSGYVFDTDKKSLKNVEVRFSPYDLFAYTDSSGYFKMVLDKQKLVNYTIVRFSYIEKSAVSRSIFKNNFPYEVNIEMRRSGKEYEYYSGTGGAPIIYVASTPIIVKKIKTFIASKKKAKKK